MAQTTPQCRAAPVNMARAEALGALYDQIAGLFNSQADSRFAKRQLVALSSKYPADDVCWMLRVVAADIKEGQAT